MDKGKKETIIIIGISIICIAAIVSLFVFAIFHFSKNTKTDKENNKNTGDTDNTGNTGNTGNTESYNNIKSELSTVIPPKNLVKKTVDMYGGSWGLDEIGSIWYIPKNGGKWNNYQTGFYVGIESSSIRPEIWLLSVDTKIYSINLNDMNTMITVPGNAKSLFIYEKNKNFGIVGVDGNLYISTTLDPKNPGFTLIDKKNDIVPGKILVKSIDINGGTWGVDNYSSVWHLPPHETKWILTEGKLIDIVAHPVLPQVWGIDTNGYVYAVDSIDHPSKQITFSLVSKTPQLLNIFIDKSTENFSGLSQNKYGIIYYSSTNDPKNPQWNFMATVI